MILVDTSVWVRHFRIGVRPLSSLLEENDVLSHPVVIGELAVGIWPSATRRWLA